MKKLLHKLSTLLTEGDDGSWSTTRFAMLFTVLISNVALFSVWVMICWYKKDIIALPTTVVSLYSLANTIVVAGKVTQKKFE
jgi:hypothetical protein